MTQSIVKTTKDGSLNTWSQWFRFDECLNEREADITFQSVSGLPVGDRRWADDSHEHVSPYGGPSVGPVVVGTAS